MPEAFALGPFLISTRIAAFIVAFLAARWIAARLARRWDLDPAWTRNTADGALVAGLAAARLAHAALYWEVYAPAPWTVLYLWQPGFVPVAGLAGGALYVLYRLRGQGADRRLPSLRAVSTGFAAGATILVVALGTMGWFAGAGGARAGDSVEDVRLVDLDGEAVALSELEGQGVVLNFWATWCPPCRREMPLLESAWNEYRSRGVVIVGVDVGESPDTVRRFVDSIGVTYPIWTDAPGDAEGFDDTNELLARFGGVGLPTTIFIGPDGVIEEVYVGELNRAMLNEWLPRLAAEE